jgi:hypothetical protein
MKVAWWMPPGGCRDIKTGRAIKSTLNHGRKVKSRRHLVKCQTVLFGTMVASTMIDAREKSMKSYRTPATHTGMMYVSVLHNELVD